MILVSEDFYRLISNIFVLVVYKNWLCDLVIRVSCELVLIPCVFKDSLGCWRTISSATGCHTQALSNGALKLLLILNFKFKNLALPTIYATDYSWWMKSELLNRAELFKDVAFCRDFVIRPLWWSRR
jgi:hypothetical protein